MRIDDEPLIVFIDTSVFENENFAFGGELLTAFVESCKDSSIELVMPDVTHDEICRRIRKSAKTANAAINKLKKETRFIKHDRDLWKIIEPRKYCQDLGDRVVSDFDKFVERTEATPLECDNVRPSQVFSKYFAIEPPFAIGDKEKEFPDAFAIETLRALSEERAKKICVVSTDKDFEKACGPHDEFICLTDIESAIELSLRPGEIINSCHEWIADNIERAIFDPALEELKRIHFSLDAPSGLVNSLENTDMELYHISVIELTDEHAVVVGKITALVELNVSYAEEGEPYYDSDDRLVIPYVDVQHDMNIRLVFGVRVDLEVGINEIKGLRTISFDMIDELEITKDNYNEYEIYSSQ
ncbi:hypothetical protein Mal52_27790 [Symmachiella dynata]|uniref:DUF4935 domain-containing protein n=1 Tax=Symmachiella dynata TaxID=2527995 RepID=A0A517ZPG1_9PLAN|nr:PIN domain-containing protein [Symmachiella dynata]QDU44300.1 hypothetical protein Mal52_27790 [Symmachiella dynata]